MGESTPSFGAWTQRLYAQRARQQGHEKKRGAHEPEHHDLGRSRGGFSTKINLVTDGKGIPLAASLAPGQAHESRYFESVLARVKVPLPGVGRPRVRPENLSADKGYSMPRIRRYLSRRGIRGVIPRKSDQTDGRSNFDAELYKNRNAIERCVGWIKENRRVGTRYDKHSSSYLAMVKLSMIRRCFASLDLTNRA